MLVLSRKPDEAIFIGEDVKITVLSIEGDRVRLGIDAPKELRIFRYELKAQTMEDNVAAAHAPAVIDISKLKNR